MREGHAHAGAIAFLQVVNTFKRHIPVTGVLPVALPLELLSLLYRAGCKYCRSVRRVLYSTVQVSFGSRSLAFLDRDLWESRLQADIEFPGVIQNATDASEHVSDAPRSTTSW